jgi:CheY-like chemotaxis protein
VLLVDPDADTREMYSEYFERKGWHVMTARDGSEALAQIARLLPTVAVTELRLPDFDGWRLISVLKNDRTTRRVPLFVVTADAFSGAIERAEAVGADLILLKPCLPDALFAAAVRAKAV